MLFRRFNPLLFAAALPLLAPLDAPTAPAYSALWGKSGERYVPGGRLPDFSYAGYHRGEASPPSYAVAVNVKDFGAKGDGNTDDTQAFKDAIAAVKSGAILVPAGRYPITDFLYIRKSGVVLRGEGPDKSVLWFPKALQEIHPMAGVTTSGSPTTAYAFDYGFVTLQGDSVEDTPSAVTAVAKRGDAWIQVASAAAYKKGQDVVVQVQVTDSADKSLASFLYSDEPGDVGIGRTLTRTVCRVMEVSGNKLRLDPPLPFETRLTWNPRVWIFKPGVTESGIENLRFDFPDVPYPGHFKEQGFNPLELRAVSHCWVKNVWFHNADMGVLFAGYASFNTVDGVIIDAYAGRGAAAGHHAFEFKQVFDNLATHFDLRVKFVHDLSVEEAHGNVYSSGKGVDLCFDHHKAKPYDNLYTDIDAGAGTRLWTNGGGSGLGRPAAGWSSFWNIRASSPLSYPPDGYGPKSMNLIGFTTTAASVTDSSGKWFEAIAPADLSPGNLHLAQLSKRLSATSAVREAPREGKGSARLRAALAGRDLRGRAYLSKKTCTPCHF